MQEFVVTLRCGLKFVVKADRVTLLDRQFLALVTSRADSEAEPTVETVGLFDRSQVTAVVAKDHLVSEQQTEPIPARYSGDGGDDIPF